MKRIMLILTLMLFSASLSAESFSDMFIFGKEKAGDAVGSVTGTKRCAITADTPFKEIVRPPIEIGASWGLVDSPSGGQTQVRLENVSITAIGNLSSTFHWYLTAGTRTTAKDEYDYPAESNTEYDVTWQSKMGFAGFGLYIMPTMRIFAGVGKIEITNALDGPPPLTTAQEYGMAWSHTLFNNRLEIMYRVVIAPLAEESPSIYDSVAIGSFNAISVGLFFPLGN